MASAQPAKAGFAPDCRGFSLQALQAHQTRNTGYYYAGFYFRFEEGEEGFVVRQYEDELEQASFQCCTVQGERVWIGHQFGCIPYDNALFRGAVRYLTEEEGVRQVKILLQGYEAVDIRKATSIDS